MSDYEAQKYYDQILGMQRRIETLERFGGGGGSGGGNTIIWNETLTGTVNGTNAVFTTTDIYVSGSILVYRDGQLMTGSGNDYTESGDNEITFTTAPASGSVLLATYLTSAFSSGNANTLQGNTLGDLLNKIYPVGSIYTNATSSTNPATLLGFGTWSAFGAGRVMVGFDSGDSDFDTAEKTGGAKTFNNQHDHKTPFGYDNTNFYSENETPTYGSEVRTSSRNAFSRGSRATAGGRYMSTDSAGSTTQSIVQPYITVYMWKRTA